VNENKFDPKQIGKLTSDIDELASRVRTFINQNCKPWLRKSGGRIVYRGMQHNTSTAFTRAIRTDRVPMDSSPMMHEVMNFMIQRVGGTANRSNSAFVINDYSSAWNYGGNVYVAMPVGEFTYTWSPQWGDWMSDFKDNEAWEDVIDFEKISQTLSPQRWEQMYQEYKRDPDRDHFGVKLSKSDFIEDTTIEMLYKMVDRGSAQEIIQHIDVEKVKQHINVDTGLPEAIRSTNEIMIHCEKMLYIDEDFLQQVSEEYYDNWIKAK
jgi:hypothetical protein